MSSERDLRRRSSFNSRRDTRLPPHPSSPSARRGTPRKLSALSEPVDFLHKCSSAPLLPGTAGSTVDNCRSLVSDDVLFRPMTCTDVFSPSPSFLSPESPRGSPKVYEEDYKVVVTVTVEGSVGPVRTMVKLGSIVDETIKLVIDQYKREGRSPPLDKDAALQFELHLSSFSLESLDRSSAMVSVRSRTFYLRKCASVHKSSALTPESDSVESIAPHQPCPLMAFLPEYISVKIATIMRRLRELWSMIGCLHDS